MWFNGGNESFRQDLDLFFLAGGKFTFTLFFHQRVSMASQSAKQMLQLIKHKDEFPFVLDMTCLDEDDPISRFQVTYFLVDDFKSPPSITVCFLRNHGEGEYSWTPDVEDEMDFFHPNIRPSEICLEI